MVVNLRQRYARVLDRSLAVVGITTILVGAVWLAESWSQIILVLAGIVLLEISTWRLASKYLPGGRRFGMLRVEVHHFLKLMRELNQAASNGRGGSVIELRQSMRDSVDRMCSFAGLEDDDE